MSTNADTQAKVLKAAFYLAITKQEITGKRISKLAGIGVSTACAYVADLRVETQKQFGSSEVVGATTPRRGRNADSAAGADDDTPAEPPKKRVKKNAAPKTTTGKKEFKIEDDEGQPVGNAPQHGDGEDIDLFDE